ncbi:hypothetical protein [Uliginosibacterium sp. H1]|uniref:hypothetical protein n=1 Tax=Uliginosibacterium sp. H1 TaxID=3114757 RepID=UPI002E19F80C|nr:hypothetical protein [Uliginosibacterium sp. H1]
MIGHLQSPEKPDRLVSFCKSRSQFHATRKWRFTAGKPFAGAFRCTVRRQRGIKPAPRWCAAYNPAMEEKPFSKPATATSPSTEGKDEDKDGGAAAPAIPAPASTPGLDKADAELLRKDCRPDSARLRRLLQRC